jgi:hypothetical protein
MDLCPIPEANRLLQSSLFRDPEPKMEPDSGEVWIAEDPIQHIKLKRRKSELKHLTREYCIQMGRLGLPLAP